MTADELDRTSALRETLLTLFLMGEGDTAKLGACLKRVAPEDVAAVLSDFEPHERVLIFKSLGSTEEQGIVLEETDQLSRRDLLEGLSELERHEVIGEMPVDDLVDHLEELPVDEQERLIAGLERDDAEEVQELRGYEPDTAGGMMTTEFISIPVDTTSGEALSAIQGNLNIEVIAYVYVSDKQGVLQGVVSIRQILRARPETPIAGYMTRDVVRVNVDTDREEVAAVVDKYNLPVVPVVDDDGRIRGIVTFDDVIDAVQEEHSEDMLRMAGTTAIHPVYEPVYVGVAKRLPFLLVTMSGGFGVVFVQRHFKDVISGASSIEIFTLALSLAHLLSGLSGNVAVVTSTVFVRGLATGEISKPRLWRAVSREVAIGCSIGVIFAFLTGVVLFFLGSSDYDKLIPAMGVGLCASIAWSGLVGALVPVLCSLSKVIDPAIASGPFVTVTCDISASIIFLCTVLFMLGSPT